MSLMKHFKKNRHLYEKGSMIGLLWVLNSPVFAADHANDFEGLYTQLLAWTSGSLGKSIALVFLLIGIGVGALRGSILGAVTCIAAALSLVIVPGVIDSIFGGTL